MVLDSIRAKFPSQEQRDEFLREAAKLENTYQRKAEKYDYLAHFARGLGLLTGAGAAGYAYHRGRKDLALGILLTTPVGASFIGGTFKRVADLKKRELENEFLWKVYNLAKEKGAEKVVVPTGKVKAE